MSHRDGVHARSGPVCINAHRDGVHARSGPVCVNAHRDGVHARSGPVCVNAHRDGVARAFRAGVRQCTQRRGSMRVPGRCASMHTETGYTRVPGWCASMGGQRAPTPTPRESHVHRPALTRVFLPLGCAWMGRAREQLCLPLPRAPHGDHAAPSSSRTPSAGFSAVTVLLCAPETPGEARSDLCTLGVWLEFKMS